MPKLAEGPPVFVRFVEPLPSPGFMRTATARPGVARPNASSWCKEQAFRKTPRRTCSAIRCEGIWDVRRICSGANTRQEHHRLYHHQRRTERQAAREIGRAHV